MNVDRTEEFPFLATERALVRRVLDAGLPYLGICLGAQMLARVLDEPVVPAPSRRLGFTPVHPTDAGRADALAGVFEDGVMAFHWHEDAFALPPGAALLVAGRDGSVQMFRHGDLAWGVVFHPEVTGPELHRWLVGSDRRTLASRWGTDTEALQRSIDRYLSDHEDRGREMFGRFAGVVKAAARP
jgi:GMP synthase (glutamine-hydrolysing)